MIIHPVLKVQNEGRSVDYSNGKYFTEIFGDIFELEDCIEVKFNMTKWAKIIY